jgi:hypothetical protein
MPNTAASCCSSSSGSGAIEHAGVGHVELITFCLEQAAGVLGLLDAGVGQVHVGPAGEAVFKVPGGFAVANQDEFVHMRMGWSVKKAGAF